MELTKEELFNIVREETAIYLAENEKEKSINLTRFRVSDLIHSTSSIRINMKNRNDATVFMHQNGFIWFVIQN